MGRHKAIPPPRPANPLRNQRQIRAPTPIIGRQPAAKPAARPAKRACPNKECDDPQVEDGVCHNCGTVIDDSQIVAEVSFGENSQGAAVVQGRFMNADQGTANTLGPGAARIGGGNDDRLGSIREAKDLMTAMAAQLKILEHAVLSGVQIYKLAQNMNFIQGRRIDMVAAVCLYSACRKEKPCNVMLIDFADKIKVNVFKLGHTFKDLHKIIPLAKDGIQPVLPEDLIFRFASKLDFKGKTTKVAEDAIRLAQRMSKDWVLEGRRPSGVCGACLILAARMNNFRRSITEVVYIVKVTTFTIQKRLEEFKVTPSSALTLEEFLNNEFLESAHDPPSFYQKQEAYIKSKKTRKRKRKDGEPEEAESPDKRHNTGAPVERRIDADGFAIPALPNQNSNVDPSLESASTPNIDPALVESQPIVESQLTQSTENTLEEVPHDIVDDLVENQTGTTFEQLVDQFGDVEALEDEELIVQRAREKLRGPGRAVHVPYEWELSERQLEQQISELISDPNTIEHAERFAIASRKSREYMYYLSSTTTRKPINMDVHIGIDEFENDPEVQNCVLSSDDAAAKERVWVNENKLWLRKQQMKEYQKRQEANAPPKATRNRKKKPKIGEGQASPASTPGEAAVNMMKQRAFSKKINYEAIRGMFNEGGDRGLGSVSTSRVTSRAGSIVEDYDEDDYVEPAINLIKTSFNREPEDNSRSQSREAAVEEEVGDDEDYVRPSPAPSARGSEADGEDWRAQLRRPREENEEQFEEDDYEAGFDQGDLEDPFAAFEGDDDGFADDD